VVFLNRQRPLSIATFLNIIHRSILKWYHSDSGALVCSHPQGKLPTVLGPMEGPNPNPWSIGPNKVRMGEDQAPETSCFQTRIEWWKNSRKVAMFNVIVYTRDNQLVAHEPHAARNVMLCFRGKVSRMWMTWSVVLLLSKWAKLTDSLSPSKFFTL
jgi:hypothetical protein